MTTRGPIPCAFNIPITCADVTGSGAANTIWVFLIFIFESSVQAGPLRDQHLVPGSGWVYDNKMEWNLFTWIFAAFLAARFALESTLDILQARYLSRRPDRVPSHLEGVVEIETIRKAISYNRDKLRFRFVSRIVDMAPLWALLLFGFAFIDRAVVQVEIGQPWSGLLFFGILGALGFLWSLPADAYYTFVVEEKHGFNKQRPGGFIADKLKGLGVAAVLGAVLGSVVLLMMKHAGTAWWLFAFAAVTILQLLITWIYPVVIMPLFNKFEPVEADLADDVARLARSVGFPLSKVLTMDGSKRSSHSNAFFTGLRGARRIVLYDTLMSSLERPQLLAVLAHELGHFKLGHVTKRIVMTVALMLAVFAVMGWLGGQGDVYSGLGFERSSEHGLVVVFGLLASEMLFPFGWVSRVLSRRDERAADRFAVEATGDGEDLVGALTALTRQNLGSPGSHRLYRAYHNTHPTLRERMKTIRAIARPPA